MVLLGPQVVDGLLGVLDPLVEPAAVRLPRFKAGLLAFQGRPSALRLGAKAGECDFERRDGLREPAVLERAPGDAQVAQLVTQSLVTHRLGCLTFKTSDLPGNLSDHVSDPGQVLVRERQLGHGLLALALVLGDSSRLLKDGAPLLGLRREDLVDLALGHDRIAGPADAGVHEELVDVLQPADLPVEQVFALPVPMDAPGDLNLVEFASELPLALREQHRDFAHLRRPAGVRPLEDHVLHLAAAKGLRALLPEDPADRIRNVGFAATVGPDHGGHAGLETEGRWIGK